LCSESPGTWLRPILRARFRRIRATGTIQALRVSNVQVPQLRGPGGRLTLIRLIPNGSRVKPGDVVAEFDRIQQLEDARDARAKMEDLSHQIDQLRASIGATRPSEMPIFAKPRRIWLKRKLSYEKARF
jgi:multidrug efflux pump subunit AcrA (membrane-fusion protein)